MSLNWNHWILQKNAEFTLEKLGLSKEQYLSKSRNVHQDIAHANAKLKSLGVTGGYSVTKSGKPTWDFEYDEKHRDAIDSIHDTHVAHHLTDDEGAHEDYSLGDSNRHTYGGAAPDDGDDEEDK